MIKFLRLLFFLLLTLPVSAQSVAPPAYAQIDYNFRNHVVQVFGALEANRVPTGLLLDYGLDMADPRIYNGALLADSTLMEPGIYSDLYKTLFTSRFSSQAPAMRHPDIHDSLCYMAREREVITLSGLLFRYNAIDPQAQATGKMQTVNGQLKDQYVNGVWQDPYQQLTTIAISPSTIRYNLTSCWVKLPSSLFLSNMGAEVSSILFNADDGRGYQPIAFDTPLRLSYATPGWKHWLFKVTLTNGQQLFCHSKIHIDNTSNVAGTSGPATAARGSVIDGRFVITATEAYLGKAGVAEVIVSYRNADDRVLRKPLIVAEGFDPGHILTPEEPEGENTLNSFIRKSRVGGSDDLAALISNESSTQYDIVYVNWRNGTDYLQRNALVLEEVIRWVNAFKQPLDGVVQPNVVLGSSMGGVIARMALGRLDRAGGFAAHQTRLYVSLDAPHQGANVPLGYQAAARHATGMYVATGLVPAVETGVVVLKLLGIGVLSPLKSLLLADQPAARQMLINRIDLFYQPANTTHQAFQQELRTTWAYPNPANIRSIAISNGSECATDQEFAPGSSLLYHYRSTKTRFVTDLLGMAAGAGLGALGAPLPLAVPLIIPGSNKIELTLDVKALADGGGNRVYYGNIKFTKKVLWLAPVSINIANRSYTAPSGLLPLDTYPGGFYILSLDSQPGAATQDWAFTYNNTFYVQRRFGYVPTTSALDLGQGNTTLVKNDYLARYVGATPPAAPLNSPFANFTTAFNTTNTIYSFDNENSRKLNNEPHERLYLRNANWLAQELNGNTTVRTNCVGACSNNNYSILGNAIICNSSVYRINNLPPGASVTWSLASGAGTVLKLEPNTPNPGELRITNQKFYTVSTTLTATIGGVGCGTSNIVLTKAITNSNPTSFAYYQESCSFYNVNHPSQSGMITTASTYVHQGCMVYVNLGSIPAGTVTRSGGQPLTWGTSTNSYYPNTLYFQLPLGSGGVPFTFTMPGNGDCGSKSLTFFSYSNNSFASYSYEAAPNPIADEVTIIAKENDEHPENSETKDSSPPLSYTVEVYEVWTGRLKMSQKNVNGNLKHSLNTSKLGPGHYILRIDDGQKSQTIKVFKE